MIDSQVPWTPTAAAQTDRARPRLALVTPWNAVCGNAEYAEHLAEGMAEFIDVVPIKLVPAPTPPDHHARLVSEIRACRPDVVHIQHDFSFFGTNLSEANATLLEFVRGIDRPIVMTLHTVYEHLLEQVTLGSPGRTLAFHRCERLCGLAGGRISRTLLRKLKALGRRRDTFRAALVKVDVIVVHSQMSADILALCFPEFVHKVRVVPIPIPASPPIGETSLRKPADEIWLAMTGFVVQFKQHKLAIRALAHLPANYRLLIAGGVHPHDPAAADCWRELLREIDLAGVVDRVTITGFIADRREFFGILNLADVFLMPYLEVGQSASAARADVLTFEKPIITSSSKSLYEYRGDIDTWACSITGHVEDARLFADEIRQAYEQSQNPAAIYRTHIRNAVRKNNRENVCQMYRRIYEECRGEDRDRVLVLAAGSTAESPQSPLAVAPSQRTEKAA